MPVADEAFLGLVIAVFSIFTFTIIYGSLQQARVEKERASNDRKK
jgi:succinate-acetate transporter protein